MNEVAQPNPSAPHASLAEVPSRLLSLDVLRGLTIGFMILVNDPGGPGAFHPLQHADWNGFTPTDLVFPTFLFLVGISTVLSLGSRLDRGVARSDLFGRVARRSLLIFVVGLVVNTFPFLHLDRIRYFGVLPRIAVCYFVVASLLLISRGWKDKAALLVLALVGYWLLMRFVSVPGYGVPTHDIPLLDKNGNLDSWLDRAVFAPQHLYRQTRDPEGILSTLPALGTTLIGLLTGLWLRSQNVLAHKIQAIAGAGVLGVVLGLLWNVSFPINKKLWTSSYVLFAGGLSLLLLALAMLLVDVPSARESPHDRARRSAWFTPFLVFGTNAIGAYVFSELLAAALYSFYVKPGMTVQGFFWLPLHHAVSNPACASLIFASSYVLVCWPVIYVLYRRRIFLKL